MLCCPVSNSCNMAACSQISSSCIHNTHRCLQALGGLPDSGALWNWGAGLLFWSLGGLLGEMSAWEGCGPSVLVSASACKSPWVGIMFISVEGCALLFPEEKKLFWLRQLPSHPSLGNLPLQLPCHVLVVVLPRDFLCICAGGCQCSWLCPSATLTMAAGSKDLSQLPGVSSVQEPLHT